MLPLHSVPIFLILYYINGQIKFKSSSKMFKRKNTESLLSSSIFRFGNVNKAPVDKIFQIIKSPRTSCAKECALFFIYFYAFFCPILCSSEKFGLFSAAAADSSVLAQFDGGRLNTRRVSGKILLCLYDNALYVYI